MYERRPVICRTHGLPLIITEEGEEGRDCCPKNFVGRGLDDLPRGDLLDLVHLNTMLVAVNTVFAAQAGVKVGVRLVVSRIPPHNEGRGL